MQKSKYLVANDRDIRWGLTISTVGYEEVSPDEPYPLPGHPDGYFFDPKAGRILNEYQLLYVTDGNGIFRSKSTVETILKAGDLFLLFPGEWHTYIPDPKSGWKCYWLGFKGRNADDRVEAGFLSPKTPFYHIGFSEEMVYLFETAFRTAEQEEAYSQQLLAGITNHIIGLMYSLEKNIVLSKNSGHVAMINRSRTIIREALESNLTIQEIAGNLGVSYSNFRKLFKEYTGLSPAIYQQDLKLQRAKELLTTTEMSIKEIAYRLGFDSPDYFSAKFKAKTGHKPSEFRR